MSDIDLCREDECVGGTPQGASELKGVVMPDADRYFPHEFEVWQGDQMCASASGPRDEALREAMHYAAQYEQDGPVRVFEVTRTLVKA